VYDPQTKLTTTFPFFAGYSWDDENLGKEARRTRSSCSWTRRATAPATP
jgi:hypothetical protein